MITSSSHWSVCANYKMENKYTTYNEILGLVQSITKNSKERKDLQPACRMSISMTTWQWKRENTEEDCQDANNEKPKVLKYWMSTESHFSTAYYALWPKTHLSKDTASTYLIHQIEKRSRGLSPSVPSYSSSPDIFSESGWHSSNSALLLHTSSGCSELCRDSSTLQQSQAFREGQTEKLKDWWKEAGDCVFRVAAAGFGGILNWNGFWQQLFCLYQLIPFLQDIPKVVHSMDIGRVQPKIGRKSELMTQHSYCIQQEVSAEWFDLPDCLSVISNSSSGVSPVSQILTNIIMDLRNQSPVQNPCEHRCTISISDAHCK